MRLKSQQCDGNSKVLIFVTFVKSRAHYSFWITGPGHELEQSFLGYHRFGAFLIHKAGASTGKRGWKDIQLLGHSYSVRNVEAAPYCRTEEGTTLDSRDRRRVAGAAVGPNRISRDRCLQYTEETCSEQPGRPRDLDTAGIQGKENEATLASQSSALQYLRYFGLFQSPRGFLLWSFGLPMER